MGFVRSISLKSSGKLVFVWAFGYFIWLKSLALGCLISLVSKRLYGLPGSFAFAPTPKKRFWIRLSTRAYANQTTSVVII